jgi:hypothetical protein
MKFYFCMVILFLQSQTTMACSANFSSNISAREFMGTHSVGQEIIGLTINENGKGMLGHLGAKSCKSDEKWHCLTSPSFLLYIPRINERNTSWSHDSHRFIKNERELTLFNKKQKIFTVTAYALDAKTFEGTIEPQGVYFFNRKMDLIGYSIKQSLDQKSDSAFFTYYLRDGVLPLSCY